MEKIQKMREKFKKILIAFIVVSISICLVSKIFLGFEEVYFIAMFLFIINIVSLTSIHYFMIQKPFKMEVVGALLNEIKPTIKYTYKIDGVEYKSIIKKYKLIPSASAFQFTDIIDDEIEGTNYRSFDLYAYHTQSNGKTTTTVTDFRGRVYEVNVEKNYCDYILKEQKWKNKIEGYHFLDLESIEFNDKFNLYVTDTHEAFKIFTPSKIKNLIELEPKYKNIMTICHFDGKLYIFLYDDSNIFEKKDNAKTYIKQEYLNQCNILKEYLKVLNN